MTERTSGSSPAQTSDNMGIATTPLPTPTPVPKIDRVYNILPSLPGFKSLDNCSDRSKVDAVSPENDGAEPLTAYEMQVDQVGIMPEGPDGDQITHNSQGTLKPPKANLYGTSESKIPMPAQVLSAPSVARGLSVAQLAIVNGKEFKMPQQMTSPTQMDSTFDSWETVVDAKAIAAEPNPLDPTVNSSVPGTKCERRCSTTTDHKVEGCLTLPRKIVDRSIAIPGEQDPKVVVKSIPAPEKPKFMFDPPIITRNQNVMLTSGYNMIGKDQTIKDGVLKSLQPSI